MCALIPTFAPRLPQWRGNTSSEDMNENFDEILYDLNTIFSQASNIVVNLNELESRIRNDIEAIGARVYAVSGMLTAYDISASGYKMFYGDFYVPQNVVYPSTLKEEDKCVVSNEFGVATLPVNNSFSKVYTINIADGKTIVAPDLKVEISPLDEADNIRIDETSREQAFDGQDSTVWERKVKYNRDSIKNSVRCLLAVTLPSMSNPYVNKIHIKPYPEGTTDVQMITYDTLVAQDVVLPSFPVDGENAVRSKMYSFNNIQPTKFKVYFRQRNNKMEDDYKTFVYGAKEFGVEKVEYRPTGKLGIKFRLPSYETTLLSKINSLRTDPDYDNIAYKVSVYTGEAEFNADLPIWTSNNAPINPTNILDVSSYGIDTIWVMIQLIQASGNTDTPLLKSITLTYTTL
jgi:hypothetical protein